MIALAVAPWIPCGCGEFWCTLHHLHASECPCPPIEEWATDPYSVQPKVEP